MSLLRTAFASSPRVIGRRFASTVPQQKKPSNLPVYLLTFGVGCAGAYYYLEQSKPSVPPRPTKSSLDPENFKDFKIKTIKPYNHNTSEFVFELPKDEASLLPVASFVLIKSSDPEGLVNEQGKPVVRPYTPVSPPDQLGQISFLIKRYETGNMSKYIHSLKEGETVAIKGPLGKFPYKENEFEQVGLIGGGSGITPLYQLLTHALDSPNNKTKFTLLYSNVTEKDILLREKFEALKKKHGDKLELIFLVDKPDANWKGPSGFINADIIKKYVGTPDMKEKLKIFICGPPAQVNAIAGKKDGPRQGELGGILKQLGYSTDQVFKF